MTQFPVKNAYIMDPSQQNRVPWAVSCPGQQVPDQVPIGSQSSRTSPLQKPPHQAFLNWVAFNRSFAPNIQDIERRTCPLVECEICFGSLEDMLGHVKECPRLSKGLYRCFETGREERIGRCESSRCLELQQCKDRIANSVNSLKRRLSPRGSGPRRQASIPLEMQSLSPEMNSGYDILCSVGLAELSGNTAVPPPAYTPTYYGSVQPPAELCSGYYSESVERSTIPSSGNYAELDAGDGSAQYSPVSLAQSQSEPAELGADVDLTYTTQRLGHYQYELSGLSTDNISYEAHHQVSALQQQPDRSLLSYLNSQETPNDWHQTFSTSDSPLPEDRYNFRPLHDEGFQNISSSTSNDLNDPIPLSSTHGYQAIYNVSLIGRGASTDSSVGNSIFSRSSNFPSRDASMSSVEPDQTPTDMSLTSDYIFLDESNRLCSEPDEIEPLSSPSTDIYDEFHHHSDSWDTQYDNGASPKDVGFVYPSHLTDMLPQEGMNGHGHFQISRKPVPLSLPGTKQSPPSFCPEIKYSPRSQSSIYDSSHSTHGSITSADRCAHCGKSFMDKSNLKRHELACKRNPVKISKRYACNFPGCEKRYTRSDALRVHQRVKQHQSEIEICC